MKGRIRVVVDTDAIIALALPTDANHTRAVAISRKLEELQATLLYPVTTITECATFFQRPLNSLITAQDLTQSFISPTGKIVEVDQSIYDLAVQRFFLHVTSKQDTLFDCIVAAVASKHKAKVIFSFDNFYKSVGFKLADSL